MIYPKNIESKIGFDQIRELLKEECLSNLGVSFVDKVRFSSDFHLIDKLLKQTEEFRRILVTGESFPSTNYLDVTEALNKIRVEGSFLLEEEFFDLKLSLKTILSCMRFFKDNEEEYPLLSQLSGAVEVDLSLSSEIDSKIDDKGQLRNNASSELQRIRGSIVSFQQQLRKTMDSLIRQAKKNGYAPDDMSLTIRDGRMVMPVYSTYKRKVKGFIHDESATGQTVYLEPAEVLELNNEIKELEYEERREIIRILMALTDRLRPHIEPLLRSFHFLGMVDFIRAKAKFAIRIEASLPTLVKRRLVDWRDTRHALLYLAHQELNKPIVPMNMELDHEQRIVLISGPNAGGKSVTLKTVALTQYMVQCGLLPSMREDSVVGVFKSVFIDIGDEQSIENDLSTYSSHLTNMHFFLRFADKGTLFLIDEFGTGTEPQFGGAIAEAILEQLHGNKAYGVINTHYSNLKKFAEKQKHIVNAAMRFDLNKLEPTYQLEIGQPGSSYAFEIAKKIGLSNAVIDSAKSKMGYTQVRYDKLLSELEHEKAKVRKHNVEIERKNRRLEKAIQDYEELKDRVDTKKKDILNSARNEASQILNLANREVEKTIRTIKEKNAEKAATKKARENLESIKEKVKPKQQQLKKSATEEIVKEAGEIVSGVLVRVKGQSTVGEVLAIRGKDAEVALGGLTSKIKVNRLERVSRKLQRQLEHEKEKNTGVTQSFKGLDINKKMANFTNNLDLRGKRVEEAYTLLESFLDEASMLGIPELRIVHGKGDGILKEFVRQQLRNYSKRIKFADEHVERGGAGVTVVTM
ncbi:endonuclease MutS2 [Aureibacter tunicatorum]|uniref:Endonuclease MutS2 n=1 Tax=Aureibacter tunicatorum TaxID=866807 RepID=A0AAE3XSD2_9BACT|nr:endonuclease MutS2 [Aureibacter tunicatorum]MDR6241223.1 DNA mismatch repair protein MutS2 [Aureibacter tunicatorum]BDD03484.1 endonuclease MutS2 [Aureibacter tunicatorum]